MTEDKEIYCLDCEFRKHQFTSRNNFCETGYRLNPCSKKATENVLLNGGEVCRFNPWRRRLRQDMYGKHGQKGNVYADAGIQTH